MMCLTDVIAHGAPYWSPFAIGVGLLVGILIGAIGVGLYALRLERKRSAGSGVVSLETEFDRTRKLARRIADSSINDVTYAERLTLVRRESLVAQQLRARLAGNDRRVARIEKQIVIGDGGRAIARRILDATWRSTLARFGVAADA